MALPVRTTKFWRSAIDDATSQLPAPITAMTYLSSWNTLARPSLFACNDDALFVVKGRENGRALMNEYMVGVLGFAMGAPVPESQRVYVPSDLISMEPAIRHMEHGVAYGSAYIANTIDKGAGIHYAGIHENRSRFAALAMLFGLVWAQDVQFIYNKYKPKIVYSIDHSEFFPGWLDNWSLKSLATADPPEPNKRIRLEVGLRGHETMAAIRQLAQISNSAIALAVAGCHDDWGVSDEDRLGRAEFIASRRDMLCQRVSE
jgi:hypothetical protein